MPSSPVYVRSRNPGQSRRDELRQPRRGAAGRRFRPLHRPSYATPARPTACAAKRRSARAPSWRRPCPSIRSLQPAPRRPRAASVSVARRIGFSSRSGSKRRPRRRSQQRNRRSPRMTSRQTTQHCTKPRPRLPRPLLQHSLPHPSSTSRTSPSGRDCLQRHPGSAKRRPRNPNQPPSWISRSPRFRAALCRATPAAAGAGWAAAPWSASYSISLTLGAAAPAAAAPPLVARDHRHPAPCPALRTLPRKQRRIRVPPRTRRVPAGAGADSARTPAASQRAAARPGAGARAHTSAAQVSSCRR